MSRPPRRRPRPTRALSLCLPAAVFPHHQSRPTSPSSSVRCHFFCVPDAICLCGRASIGSLRRTPRSFVRVPRRSFDPSRACPVSLCSVFLFSVTIRRCLRIPTPICFTTAKQTKKRPQTPHPKYRSRKNFTKIFRPQRETHRLPFFQLSEIK